MAHKLTIPLTILPGILFFVFAQILVHLFYCLLVWFVTITIAILFNFNQSKAVSLGMFFWFFGIITSLLANAFYFPNSNYAALLSLYYFNDVIVKVCLILLLSAGSVALLLSATQVALWAMKRKKMLLTSLILLPFFGFLSFKANSFNQQNNDKPNIIIIVVDSLRPDFLSFFWWREANTFFGFFIR